MNKQQVINMLQEKQRKSLELTALQGYKATAGAHAARSESNHDRSGAAGCDQR